MKVKSFTYERNWTGKYYRQRLFPTMQTMDRHIVGIPVKVNIVAEKPFVRASILLSHCLGCIFVHSATTSLS